jgi:hypothetical protein
VVEGRVIRGGSALSKQAFGMTRKVHRLVQHAANFDAIIPHSKQDGMPTCQADAAVREKDARHLVQYCTPFPPLIPCHEDRSNP